MNLCSTQEKVIIWDGIVKFFDGELSSDAAVCFITSSAKNLSFGSIISCLVQVVSLNFIIYCKLPFDITFLTDRLIFFQGNS